MAEEDEAEPSIAVIGMAGRFGVAHDVDAYWRLLRDSQESIRSFEHEELRQAGFSDAELELPSFVPRASVLDGIDLFDAQFFGLSHREAQFADPQLRLMLECAWESLETAGYDADRFDGRIGVYAGASSPTYFLSNLLGLGGSNPLGALSLGVLNFPGHLASQIAYRLNLTGPSINVQTACSTSLVALSLACQALIDQDCDMALAGGVSVRLPNKRGYIYVPEGIFSTDGRCRPFDAAGDGTVFGDGLGMVVLRRLEDAVADGDNILAVVRGWAVNNDGRRRAGYSAPSVEGQTEVVSEALSIAGVDPREISYVEAHGTATRIGDPIELTALSQVFARNGTTKRNNWCGVGSAKGNIGHADAAAGIAGFIKVVLSLQNEAIPPTLHYRAPNPNFAMDTSPFRVVAEFEPWPRTEVPRKAGVSSFGLGGTNAHVIVEEAPAQPAAHVSKQTWQLMLVSAPTRQAREHLSERWASFVQKSEAPLADIAFTSRVGRRVFKHRQAVVADGPESAATALRDAVVVGEVADALEPSIVFLFPGQGSQAPGMAAGLYQQDNAFRAAFDRCAQIVDRINGTDLTKAVFSIDGGDELVDTRWTQPAVFSVSYALAELWESFGIKPHCLMGHSLGEYVAACRAGVMDLEAALKIVSERARLMASLPRGKMAVVPLGPERVIEMLDPGVELAVVNGAQLCTVAGTPEAVSAWLLSPRIAELGCTELRVSHAFHSAMMDPILDAFRDVVARHPLQAPTTPYVSNLTGTWITPEQATSPDYYAQHIRKPVQFARGLECIAEPGRVAIEVGHGRTLTSLTRMHMSANAQDAAVCVSTLAERGLDASAGDYARFLTAVGRVWTVGVDVDWTALVRGERRRRVLAPTYPFNRRRYWLDAKQGLVSGGAEALSPGETSLPAVERPDLDEELLKPRNEVERLLSGIWEEVLGATGLGVNDNFFALGGHSLSATNLVRRVEQETGVGLRLRDFLEKPTIAEMARVVATSTDATTKALPQITPQRDALTRPFPLTDVQQAYWMGRVGDFALGGVTTHVYREVDVIGFQVSRATQALDTLVARHGMLRATVDSEGLQRIADHVPPYQLDTTDLRQMSEEQASRALSEIRSTMEHQLRPADTFPLWEVRAALLPGERTRLFISLDMLTLDAASIRILLAEFAALYLEPTVQLQPIDITFRDYVLAEASLRDSGTFGRAEEYWNAHIPTMPLAPELPIIKVDDEPRFARWSMRLDDAVWSTIKRRASELGVTASAVLVTVFAQVIGAYSKHGAMTLSLTMFRRLPIHPHINRVVGDFTSILPLIIDDDAEHRTLSEQIVSVNLRLWEGLDHSGFNGVKVIRELRRRRGTDITLPIVFTSTLDLGRSPGETDNTASGESEVSRALTDIVQPVYSVSQTPQVLIDCQAGESAGALWINWDAVADAFPTGFVETMFQVFRTRVEALQSDETWRTRELPIPDPQLAARQDANSTNHAMATARLHDGFFECARRRPEAVALAGAGLKLSYGEVHRKVCALAHRMGGLPLGSRVGIVMQKGWEQIVSALAVVSVGCAYVPIDSSLPVARIESLLADVGARVLIVDATFVPDSPLGTDREVIAISDLAADPAVSFEPVRFDDSNLAYIIYTSGSTGIPKGVMVSHRAAMNTIAHINDAMEVDHSSRVLALSSLSFDLSVFDTFGVLGNGGTVVLPQPNESRMPERWLDLVREHEVTIWNSVPALLELFVEHLSGLADAPALQSVRVAMVSGDWVPVTLQERMKSLLPNARLWSLGGATEAAIWSIAHAVQREDRERPSVPYGKPLRNQRFHVLHPDLTCCPTWVPGELYIEGEGLAMGYWARPRTTAMSFIPGFEAGQRLYRTGDWGRYLPDGSIEFLGREDNQVKVGGYRIELGEIEATLDRHPDIRLSGVCAPKSTSGARRLVGYFVSEREVETKALRAYLAEKLPAYMIPPTLQRLDTLPLTANGKVDRAALNARALAHADVPTPQEVKPGGNVLEAVQEIVFEVLSLRPEPRASLLELGADSVSLVRVANALQRRFGVRPSLAKVFEDPTAAAVARLIESDLVSATPQQQKSEAGGEGGLAGLLHSLPGAVVRDPAAVDELKRDRFVALDARHNDADVAMTLPGSLDEANTANHHRRSQRQFADGVVATEALAAVLSVARRVESHGKWKFRYASAGGLYPILTYVTVHQRRVSGLDSGTYFYDSGAHLLRRIADYAPEAGCYGEGLGFLINRPTFESSAFGVILVADLSAIGRVYGQKALLFSAMEAGALTHEFELAAADRGLGACHIGEFDSSRFAQAAKLGPAEMVLHHLLVGTQKDHTLSKSEEWEDVEF